MTINNQHEPTCHFTGEKPVPMPEDTRVRAEALAFILAARWDSTPRIMVAYIHELWTAHHYGPVNDYTDASRAARKDMAAISQDFAQMSRARRAVVAEMRKSELIKGKSVLRVNEHEHEKLMNLVRDCRKVAVRDFKYTPIVKETYEGMGFRFDIIASNNGNRVFQQRKQHFEFVFSYKDNPDRNSTLTFTVVPPDIKVTIVDQASHNDWIDFDYFRDKDFHDHPGAREAEILFNNQVSGTPVEYTARNNAARTLWLMRWGVPVRETVTFDGNRERFEHDMVALKLAVG
jgi:hypothetical protein